MIVRSPIRLSKPVQVAIYTIGLGTWISGCLWLLLDHFFVQAGEFGPEKNPLEPWVLRTHGLIAVGAVFLLGLLWGIHIQTAWPKLRRRVSGVLLTASLLLLTASGYLLYYVAGETLRQLISVAHWGIGILLPLLFFFHRWKSKRRIQS